MSGGIDAAFDSLFLQATEEGLRYRIVPTISTPVHTTHQLIVLAPEGKVITAKLAFLVGMNHHRGYWAPAPHSHRERIQDQLRDHSGVHRPADHHASIQVNDCRQVQPTLMGSDIRYVGDPHLLRQRNRQRVLQPIRRDSGRKADPVAWPLVAIHRAQLELAHQACHTLLTARHLVLTQVLVNAWTAVYALAVVKGCQDASQQDIVGQGTFGLGGWSSKRNSHCAVPTERGTCC